MLRLVIHLVPQLPPAVCGIGDYATLVGEKMESLQPGLRCAYLACGPRATGIEYDVPQFYSMQMARDGQAFWNSIASIADASECDRPTLVLHYSGYGYDPTGAPTWLAGALRNRPHSFADARLLTFYHELFATGRPWELAFWYSGRQRRVAARLAMASKFVATNRVASARWLAAMRTSSPQEVACLPIPSNVGEPEHLLHWSQREPVAVLFGGARFKQCFLKMPTISQVVELCKQCEINRLVNIGERVTLPNNLAVERNIEIVQTGVLPAREVSSHFESARLAFIDYFPGYFAKSGVLGAAAAHGVPPITLRDADSEDDGLIADRNYFRLGELLSAEPESIPVRMRHISEAIYDWYSGHSLEHHARALADGCDLEYPRRRSPRTVMPTTR